MMIFFPYLLGSKNELALQQLQFLPESDMVEQRIKAETLAQLPSPHTLPQLPNLLKAPW